MIFQSPHLIWRRGFTLVELMISIALVLILMIGINKVFKLTADTVSIGQAVSGAVRDSRAAQATYSDDLSNLADDSPFLLIRSMVTPAFRNRGDEQADRDYDPTATVATRQTAMYSIDLNNNNQEGEGVLASPGEIIRPTDLNNRNHRTDVLSFFTRGLRRRVTGNAGVYAADMSANESLVWYGHLWLPNNGGTDPNRWYVDGGTNSIPTFPGAGTFSAATNPNNFYATQWVFGRVAVLMRQPDPTTNPPQITDQSGVVQNFIHDFAFAGTGHQLAPFAGSLDGTPGNSDSQSTALNAGDPQVMLRDSRYDLAGTTIRDYSGILSAYIGANAGTPWWNALMLPVPPPPNPNGAFTPNPPSWPARYRCDPYLIDPTTGKRQINARTMATSSPYFIPGCTQFAVEYAGDFIAQDTNPTRPTYGQIGGTNTTTGAFTAGSSGVPWTATGASNIGTLPGNYIPDGQLDFLVTANGERRIRWYGLPRDADGDGIIPGKAGSNGANDLPDPVPLRDVIATATGYTTFPGAPFEKLAVASATPNPTVRVHTDYAAQPAGPNPNNGMLQDEYYTAAWGPSDTIRPKLIRIIMTIDEPGGRTAQGQTYEFIYKLP